MLQLIASELMVTYVKSRAAEEGIPSEKFHWSVSHSHHYVIAVACEEPIGVDLERNRNIHPIPMGFFSEVDYQHIVTSNDPQELLRVWTAKEALLKCAGTDWSNPKIVDLSVTTKPVVWNNVAFYLKDCHPISDYVTTLCTKSLIPEPAFESVRAKDLEERIV